MARALIGRTSVDLSAYPDLVIVYLGMRVNTPRGLVTLLKIGRQIQQSVESRPEGLLLHEPLFYSLLPPHVGMRQYWRDFSSLESWTRAMPHRQWWIDFLTKPSGTGFWHEAYSSQGGIEAIYDGLPSLPGLGAFAPSHPARGSMLSARKRLGLAGEAPAPPMAPEP